MPTFSFEAYDKPEGAEVTGTIDGADQADALAQLRQRGMVPIELRPTRGGPARRPRLRGATLALPGGGWFGRVKPVQTTRFTRQLAILQRAGMPLVQSLLLLTDMQPPGRFRRALAVVTSEVQSGTMLSEAMARHPAVWDRLYTNLVKAGETAGALEVILRRLAEFREKTARLKKKVIGALVYPCAVMTIAVGILSFIMIVIVPKFEQIFRELNIPLPDLTELLITISRGMASQTGLAVLGGAIGAVVLTVFLRRHTLWGANLVDRAVLHVPVLGNVIRKSAVARFTRTLGTLVSSGVGFLDALEIVRSATPNVVVRDAIRAVRESVKEGETINAPLRRSGVFDDLVVNLIKLGEETGELDTMLAQIADTYEEEVDAAVAAMMALVEPALLIVMGGAVGFIVIALFLPLISILNSPALGGG